MLALNVPIAQQIKPNIHCPFCLLGLERCPHFPKSAEATTFSHISIAIMRRCQRVTSSQIFAREELTQWSDGPQHTPRFAGCSDFWKSVTCEHVQWFKVPAGGSIRVTALQSCFVDTAHNLNSKPRQAYCATSLSWSDTAHVCSMVSGRGGWFPVPGIPPQMTHPQCRCTASRSS